MEVVETHKSADAMEAEMDKALSRLQVDDGVAVR